MGGGNYSIFVNSSYYIIYIHLSMLTLTLNLSGLTSSAVTALHENKYTAAGFSIFAFRLYKEDSDVGVIYSRIIILWTKKLLIKKLQFLKWFVNKDGWWLKLISLDYFGEECN